MLLARTAQPDSYNPFGPGPGYSTILLNALKDRSDSPPKQVRIEDRIIIPTNKELKPVKSTKLVRTKTRATVMYLDDRKMDEMKAGQKAAPSKCCGVSLKRLAFILAVIQTAAGIGYALYAVIYWMFPNTLMRVKSTYESYYAFVQPLLQAATGVTLCWIILIKFYYEIRSILFTTWLIYSFIHMGSTIYRMDMYYHDKEYHALLVKHKGITYTEFVISVTYIIFQIFQIAITLLYYYEEKDKEFGAMIDQDEMGKEDAEELKIRSGEPIRIKAYKPVPQPRVFTAAQLVIDRGDGNSGNQVWTVQQQRWANVPYV